MEIKEEDLGKVMELIQSTQKVFVFILDGSLFKGHAVSLSKEYVNENPSKKFRIWLIDKGLLIDDNFDVNYIKPKREDKLY